jgi:hypothetical protein
MGGCGRAKLPSPHYQDAKERKRKGPGSYYLFQQHASNDPKTSHWALPPGSNKLGTNPFQGTLKILNHSSHESWKYLKKSILGRENGMCKGPEARVCQ